MAEVELFTHQHEALRKLSPGKILVGGVGSGKSLTAVAYYDKEQKPKDVYVITTAKKRDDGDWEEEFIKYGVGTAPGATTAGVLMVDSWNNIGKYRDVEGGFFIFDEQRLVGSGTWTKDFLRIAESNDWILLSATPGDTWLDYIPVFLANGFYKNRTEFMREHVVFSRFSKYPKVDRIIGAGKLFRLRNELIVEMPYIRHTTRIEKDVVVEYDKVLMDRVTKDRWHIYEDRPLRDAGEMFMVMRKVVNSDPSRLEKVKEIWEKHPKLIVFYNFNYELEQLRSLSKSSPTTSTGTTTDGCTTSPFISSRENKKATSKTALSVSEESNTTPKTTTPSGSMPPSETTVSVAEWNVWNQRSSDSYKLEKTDESASSENESLKDAPTADVHGLRMISSETYPKAEAPATVAIAEWNGWRHEPVPTTDRWLYLVQYTAGAEGWECITTDTTLFHSKPYSYKIWEQSHGRIDRLNTPFVYLTYYALTSESVIDRGITKALKMKQDFNEKRYAKKVGIE